MGLKKWPLTDCTIRRYERFIGLVNCANVWWKQASAAVFFPSLDTLQPTGAVYRVEGMQPTCVWEKPGLFLSSATWHWTIMIKSALCGPGGISRASSLVYLDSYRLSLLPRMSPQGHHQSDKLAISATLHVTSPYCTKLCQPFAYLVWFRNKRNNKGMQFSVSPSRETLFLWISIAA